MPRGGYHPRPDGKKWGRPKQERLSNPRLADKILHDIRAYELEIACIRIEIKRLGINLDDKNWIENVDLKTVRPESLFKMLDRLKCHARGNPMDTVNHQHDKPIDLNVSFSMAEIVRKVRERKQQYERERS